MAGEFLSVNCKCGQEHRIYSHSSMRVSCSSCKAILVEHTGGKAVILAEIVKE